jgi:hypothetical protein
MAPLAFCFVAMAALRRIEIRRRTWLDPLPL